LQQVTRRSVPQLAREGASLGEWRKEALRKLLAIPGVDRAGIWLATDEEGSDSQEPAVLRGEMREAEEDFSSTEWTSLPLASYLPLELLSSGKTARFSISTETREPIFGPAMGMRQGLWTPVLAGESLRGVLLAAAQDAEAPMELSVPEEVAAELGLALEWEERGQAARERKADLDFASEIYTRLAAGELESALLQRLVESCTASGEPGGLKAMFALVGQHRVALGVEKPSEAHREERLELLAASGDSAWAHSVDRGPLEMFWRRAVATGETVEADAGPLPLAAGMARIVALPVAVEGAVRGVLIAGLTSGGASLEILERLEHRARLAAHILQRQERISERKSAEWWRQALLASSERPLLLLDRQGFVRGASGVAAELMGRKSPLAAIRWDRPELRLEELFRPRDWERANEWYQQIRVPAGENSGPHEPLRLELKNGSHVLLRPLHTGLGEFIALWLDPETESSRERTREDVESELRQTVEWMEEGVVLFDEAGRVRAANERFHRMLGLTPEESAEARTFEDLLRLAAPHARDPEQFARAWRALAESPDGENQEELLMSWPVPQTLERFARDIIGEKGRRLGRVEVYREMSARRLFQSRMAQTEKLASMGQRVSSIVHELSNPLTTILGYAQRLLPRVASSSAGMVGEVRGILGEAERATGVLRQLLRVSSEAHGARDAISLNDLLDRTVGVIRATLAGSPIRLVVEKERGLPRIEGDFGQLQQVLLNLLQNAQQAIEQSGKGGLIGVRTASAGEGRVRLEVWDDGPGIPGAIQARIFDPFFTTKPPGIGTGLGLAIVLGFVRQHGGTVNVMSPPRGGTRFLLEFPSLPAANAIAVRPPEVTRFAPRLRLRGGLAAGQRAAKVLVVEDEPTVGGLIADVLRDEGMRVDVLRDGHAALARTEYETYDLVICDLKMPGMDGKKFFHSLGQRHSPLQEHMLFVTGDVVAPSTQEFLERHRLPYVAKPFRVEELSRAVHELL
jgi:signal transduction histidine kinase/CheY-like chemotaxis protein